MCKQFEVSRFKNLFKKEGGDCFMSATRISRIWVNDKVKLDRLKLLRILIAKHQCIIKETVEVNQKDCVLKI